MRTSNSPVDNRALDEADQVLYLQSLLKTNSEVLVAEGKTRKELEDGCADGLIAIEVCYGYKINGNFWKWRAKDEKEWSCDRVCVKKEPDMTPKEPKPKPEPKLDIPRTPHVPNIVYGESLSETS